MKKATWLVAAAALLGTSAAWADKPTLEITPFVGYRMGGQFDVNNPPAGYSDSVDLQDGGSWGVDVGIYRDAVSFYEILYSQQSTDLDSHDASLKGADVKVEYLQFGGTLLFPDQSDVYVPYLSLTIGATFLQPDGDFDSETKFSGSIGGGFRFPISENVAAILGVRGYLTLLESDTDLFCVSDSTQAGCLVRSSGSTFFQAEGQLGLSVRF